MTKTGPVIDFILSSQELYIDEDLINGIISPNPTNEQNGHKKEDDRTARNLLLAERSRKPGLGEIHGGQCL